MTEYTHAHMTANKQADYENTEDDRHRVVAPTSSTYLPV